MSLALTSDRLHLLRDRAAMFKEVRSFFAERTVLEVDVPILSRGAPIDVHIDLMHTDVGSGKRFFLHSSPEYGMKRLLAEKIGDIYQLSHVFRLGEVGALHNPEFTMVEWYRMGFSLEEMIRETFAFVRLFLPHAPATFEVADYQEVFVSYTGRFPSSLEERDPLFAFEIEPHLGRDKILILRGFPKEQAALAQIDAEGKAERFELFYQGIELANGYHELIDPIEQRGRFVQANEKRAALGKECYPLDEAFLSALERGIPDCCGVAVGFDRLMVLRHALNSIAPTLSFAWE